MRTYKKDKRGEYSVLNKWVDAWRGGGNYVAGFCTKELRQYADGPTRVVSSECRYVMDESSDIVRLHSIFMLANDALIDEVKDEG